MKEALFVLRILLPSKWAFYGTKIRTVQEFQLDLNMWDLFFDAVTATITNLLGDVSCFYVRGIGYCFVFLLEIIPNPTCPKEAAR